MINKKNCSAKFLALYFHNFILEPIYYSIY
jgi:hypothetical protein